MRPDVKQLAVNIKQYFLISALYFIVFMGFSVYRMTGSVAPDISTLTINRPQAQRNNHYSPMEQYLGKSITNIK